jgi:hypothetical protein
MFWQRVTAFRNGIQGTIREIPAIAQSTSSHYPAIVALQVSFRHLDRIHPF